MTNIKDISGMFANVQITDITLILPWNFHGIIFELSD